MTVTKTETKDKAYPKIADFVSNGSSANNIKDIYESCVISPDEEVPEPEPVFGVADPMHGDIFVGTKDNISLFKGAKKSRKTFVISAIASAVAGNCELMQFKSMLGRKGRVLYIDTEQGRYDCKKVIHREVEMSGMDIAEFKKQVTFISLRRYAPAERKEIIEYALTKHGENIDLVIIDGIRDLISNINDAEESTEIVTSLMAWSSDYNIHIISILHENKSNQNSRGHIGTELDNKSESIIRVVKAENDEHYSSVEAENMRGHSFDPYLFTIDETGIPVMADTSIDFESTRGKGADNRAKKSGPKSFGFEDLEKGDHAEIIKLCFLDAQGMFDNVDSQSAKDFHKKMKIHLKARGHEISDHKMRQFTEKYLDNGLLKDLNEDNETKHKKLVPGFDDDFPF